MYRRIRYILFFCVAEPPRSTKNKDFTAKNHQILVFPPEIVVGNFALQKNEEMTQQKSLLSWIYTFAGKKKKLYLLSVIFAIISVAFAIAPYFVIADIVNHLLAGTREWDFYLERCALTALFWLGNSLFHMFSTAISHMATFSLLASIRKTLCDKLARLPLGTVLNMPSGALKNILVERIDSMETTLAHIVPEYTSNLLLPLVLFGYLFSIDWRLGLASLATLPIAMVCLVFVMKDAQERFAYAIEKTKVLNDTAVEYINGIEVIKAFGKSKSSYDKFVIAAEEGSACYVEWMRDCIWPFTIAIVFATSTLLPVLPLGGYFFWNGTLSATDFITIIILSMSLIQPILTVYSYHDDIAKATVIFEEVGSVLEKKELNRPAQSLTTPEDYSIRLSDVHFCYQTDGAETPAKEVLHGISMYLPQGSFTAFVGPSGSGKSTIARLIASLWDVNTGKIEIGGVDLRDLSLTDYNNTVAFVNQDNFLFDLSIRENIRLAKPEATDDEVTEIAKKAGCYDFIMGLENGFDTIVGGSGTHLSGGERQRIAIARAMMKDAPIVILDEATSYTDPESEATIQESVAQLVKGKTLIVIAHRLSTIKDADKIYVIQDGTIESSGTHEELLAEEGLYWNMWNAHISAKDTDKEEL